MATKTIEFKGGQLTAVASTQEAAEEFIRLYTEGHKGMIVFSGEMDVTNDAYASSVSESVFISIGEEFHQVGYTYTFFWGQSNELDW